VRRASAWWRPTVAFSNRELYTGYLYCTISRKHGLGLTHGLQLSPNEKKHGLRVHEGAAADLWAAAELRAAAATRAAADLLGLTGRGG
jgi:hypothetical protein